MKKKIVSLLLAFSILVSVFAVLPAISVGAATVKQDNDSVLSENDKKAETLTTIDGKADGTVAAPYEIWNKAQLLDFAALVNGTGTHAESKNIYACAILKAHINFNDGYKYSYDETTLRVLVTIGDKTAYVGTGLNGSTDVVGAWYANSSGTDLISSGDFVKPEFWTPIGGEGRDNAYKGTFNGNGYSVSGIFVANDAKAQGFFGYTGSDSKSGVNITGLTIKNSCIVGSDAVGGIVGYVGTNYGDNSQKIGNSLTDVNVRCVHNKDLDGDGDLDCPLGYEVRTSDGADNISNAYGIKNVKITYCNNDNTLVCAKGFYYSGKNLKDTYAKVGGVVGEIQRTYHYFTTDTGSDCKIQNRSASSGHNDFTYLENTGTILASAKYSSGVIGYADFGYISNDFNRGKVISTSSYVAGVCPGGDNIVAQYLFNYGDIKGSTSVVGVCYFRNRGISYCYNEGDVEATNGIAFGVGYAGDGSANSVSNCANIGTVKASDSAAGVYGSNKEGVTITLTRCYNSGRIVAPKAAAQLICTFSKFKGSIILTTSMYLKNAEEPYITNPEVSVLKPLGFNESELEEGVVCERLGTGYFHQELSDKNPIPGNGSLEILIQGDGSLETPYLIYNSRQLKEFAKRVNASTSDNNSIVYSNVKLMADIGYNRDYSFEFYISEGKYFAKITDQNNVVSFINVSFSDKYKVTWFKDDAVTEGKTDGFIDPETWTPIGQTSDRAFKGTFDGNGHSVSGLFSSSTSNGIGLFGNAGSDAKSGVVIKNVTVKNSCFVANSNVGGVVGYIQTNVGDKTTTSAPCDHRKDSSGVRKCAYGYDANLTKNTQGDADSNENFAPYGIKSIDVLNCNNENTIILANQSAGGVIGTIQRGQHNFITDINGKDETFFVYNRSNFQGYNDFKNLKNSGVIYAATGNVGGVVGYGKMGYFSRLENYGNVYSDGSNVAGILSGGDNIGQNYFYNYANIYGKDIVAGVSTAGNRSIFYAYNEGTVEAFDGNAAGVIYSTGDASDIKCCANVGTVIATGIASGVFAGGKSGREYNFYKCYNSGEINSSGGKNAQLAYMNSNFDKKLTFKSSCYYLEKRNGEEKTIEAVEKDSAAIGSFVDKDKTYEFKLTELNDKDRTLLSKLGSDYGQSVNMKHPIPGYKASLVGTNVDLMDGIFLNFYIEVSTHLEKDVDETVAEPVTVQGKKCYKYTKEVAAKEMGVVQDIIIGDATLSTSVEAYANKILAGDYDEKVKDLVQAMLNYGAAAQQHFSTEEVPVYDLVGTPITDEEVANLKIDNVPEAKVLQGDDWGYIGSSIVLNGKLTLNFYFSGNDPIEAYVNGTRILVDKKTDDYFVISIGVTPENIDTAYTVKVGYTEVTYSVLNYIDNKIKYPDSEHPYLDNLVASICAYNLAADAYLAYLYY